jgi:hypothetical protein
MYTAGMLAVERCLLQCLLSPRNESYVACKYSCVHLCHEHSPCHQISGILDSSIQNKIQEDCRASQTDTLTAGILVFWRVRGIEEPASDNSHSRFVENTGTWLPYCRESQPRHLRTRSILH